MTRLCCPSLGLLFFIGFILAGAELDRAPRALPSGACQDHSSFHSRLDQVEKKVELTVEQLEEELAALLDVIEAPKWRPLLENPEKTIDILQDPAEVQMTT
ncbi:placenta-specific protein 9-like [Synchiropus picturatus]